MALAITIPETAFPVGAGQSPVVPIQRGRTQAILTVNQIGWPFAGGPAVTYQVQVSLDGGATWKTQGIGGFDDTQSRNGFDGPLNQFSIRCSIAEPDTNDRQVRLSWEFFKVLTISGTLDVN